MTVPMEPNADMRTMAISLRQMFIALTQEGFSENQAMSIIGVTLSTALLKPPEAS